MYREELGQTTVYDEEWNLIIEINITNTHERMTIFSNLKDFLSQNCNDCSIRSTIQNEKVIPLPHQRTDGIFESLIIDYEYMMIERYTNVPVDKEIIDKCKIIEGLRICKRQQQKFLTLQQTTCDASILDKHSKGKCKLGAYLLLPETYIPVSNGYLSTFTEIERLDLRLNVSPIPVQIVESRGAPSSYAVLKKFHGLAW